MKKQQIKFGVFSSCIEHFLLYVYRHTHFLSFLQNELKQRATTKEKGTYRKEGTKPRPSKSDKPKA